MALSSALSNLALVAPVSAGHTNGLVGSFLVQPAAETREDRFIARFENFLGRLEQPNATLLERPILPPAEWLADGYYSGPLRREFWEQKSLDFIELAPGDIFEIIVTGAIGTGKSALLKAVCMYDLYRMSCFAEPQRAMGIGGSETIVMVLVSLNVNKAKAKLLGPLRVALDQTPYFRKEFRYDPQKTAQLEFPKGITVKSGVTGEGAVHSEDVAWLGISEANFLPVVVNSRRKRGTDTLDVAADLVEATVRRMKSRFQQGKDLLPLCRLILDSSRQYPEDYVERRIAEINRGTVGHKAVVISRSVWQAKRGVRNAAGDLYFKGGQFPIEVGNEQRFSHILTPEEVSYAKGRIVWAADELRADFERDIEGALRDYAGEAVLSLKPLISNRDAIVECVRDEPEWPVHACEHPFTLSESTMRDGGRLIEGLLIDPGTKKPRISPDKLRCAHVDFALTGDRLGFAMGHVYDVTTIQRGGAEAQMLDLECSTCRGEKVVACARCGGKGIMAHFGHKTKCAQCKGATILQCGACRGTGKHGVPVDRPIVYIDFMLRIVPPDNGQIQFDDVEALLTALRGMGFSIPVVTADGYESAQFLQRQASKYGARIAEELSVDKTKEPYYALRNAVYDKDNRGHRRLSFYDYGPFYNELIRVEDRPLKIDHPYQGCFVADTRVPLLDGTMPMIYELVGREAWVYSVKPDGAVVPGLAKGRLSRYVYDVVDVILDSGAVVRCTPEHPWMLFEGSYKQAQELRPGIDRLMPVNHIWPINGGYEAVSNKDGEKVLTHHMVHRFFKGDIPEGYIIHHVNGVKTDNRPENLELVLRKSHAAQHTKQRHEDDAYRKKLYQGLVNWNNSEDGRSKHSEAAKRTLAKRTPEEWQSMARKRKAFRADVTFDTLLAMKYDPNVMNANIAARVAGCSRNVIIRVLKDRGFASWEAFRSGTNHKVRAIVRLRYAQPVPVYDLEIQQWNNFALSCGVFVHNSKDLGDAVAGVVFNCERITALQHHITNGNISVLRI